MHRVTTLLSLFTLATSATAVVVRHDRPDARYLSLARAYPSACDVGSDGQGVLIAPSWVLTAGHVAHGLSPFNARVGFTALGATRAERDVAVVDVIPYPKFSLDGPVPQHDIALLRLARPVTGIAPASLYEETDEAGQEVTFVGCGMTGNGQTGATHDDHTWRGATNRVAEASAEELRFHFDQGDSATELEGFWGGGDSGSPCYLTVDGETFVVGIGSYGGDINNDGKPATYGDQDVSFRVSFYREWIEGHISTEAREKVPAAQIVDLKEPLLPTESDQWECINRYFDARSASAELRQEFQASFAAENTGDLWLIEFLPAQLPGLRPLRYAIATDGTHFVALKTDLIDEQLLFRFDFNADAQLAGTDVQPLGQRPIPKGGAQPQ